LQQWIKLTLLAACCTGRWAPVALHDQVSRSGSVGLHATRIILFCWCIAVAMGFVALT
jgi:hypothetical protein